MLKEKITYWANTNVVYHRSFFNEQGLRHGLYRSFSVIGKLDIICCHKNDLLHSVFIYYYYDKIQFIVAHKEGMKNGISLYFLYS